MSRIVVAGVVLLMIVGALPARASAQKRPDLVIEWGLGGAPGAASGKLATVIDPMLVAFWGAGVRSGGWLLEATWLVTGEAFDAQQPTYFTLGAGVALRRYLAFESWAVRGGDAILAAYGRVGMNWTWIDGDPSYEQPDRLAVLDGWNGAGASAGLGLELQVTGPNMFTTIFLDVGREVFDVAGTRDGKPADGAITTVMLGSGWGF